MTILYFLFFAAILCSLERKLGQDWLIKCLKKRSGLDRCIEYDFMVTMAFLKNQEYTSSFSPLCSDINVLIQCIEGDFGSENCYNGAKDLKFVMDQIQIINPDVFNAFSHIYERNDVLLKKTMTNEFFKKIFPLPDAEKVFSEYNEWVNKQSHGLIKPPLQSWYFESSHRIYASLLYFQDEWAEAFDSNMSHDIYFKMFDGRYTPRKFLRKKGFFKCVQVRDNLLEYQIVAIPFKKESSYDLPRYMVYLIPINHSTDLSQVWDSFYTFSKRSIKNLITKLDATKIDLCIPAVEKLQSNFDCIDFLGDVFKHNTAHSCSSTMVTYININETGLQSAAHMVSDCVYSYGETFYDMGTYYYISFIFDMQSERIINIIKDTGSIKINRIYFYVVFVTCLF